MMGHKLLALAIAGLSTMLLSAAAAEPEQTVEGKSNSTLKTESLPVVVPKAPAQVAPPAVTVQPKPDAEPANPLDHLKQFLQGDSSTTSGTTQTDRVYYLAGLKYRTARHTSPDALVYIKKGFDPTKPVVLVVHNHGLERNVVQELSNRKVQEQLENSPPNTVFLMPEWAVDPAASSSNSGPFTQPGFFKNMLVEVFSKTEPLRNISIDQISEIHISTFSGGFRAAASEISKNGLEDKVKGLTLLDSGQSDDSSEDLVETSTSTVAVAGKRILTI